MPTLTLAAHLYRLLKPKGPSAWLFKKKRLDWFSEPALRRQLPLPMRLFAVYAGWLRHLPQGAKLPLGDKVLAMTSGLCGVLGSDRLDLTVDDVTVSLDLRDPRFVQVVSEVRPGHPVGDMLSELLEAGGSFLDVGANHGSFSLVAGRVVGAVGRVVAVEPNPRLAARVGRALELSNLCPFAVLEIACGDEDGEIDLFVPRSSSGSAGVFRSYSAAARHQQVRVRMQRFDQAFDWRSLPGKIVLKLDVEGSELAFLRGATAMIRERKPTIVIEFNPTSLAAAQVAAQDLIGCLKDLGYAEFASLTTPESRFPWSELDTTLEDNLVLHAAAD